MKNNIILVGMMGAGKTFIGKNLHNAKPEMILVDIDQKIETNSKMKISEIFETYSEAYFRELETKTIKEVCNKDNQIISLGGGAFENELNRSILSQNGITIYLKASAETLYERIKNETHRPLLQQGFGVEKIKEILDKREHNYRKASIIIDTENKTPYNIIEEVLKGIDNYAK